MSEIFVGVFCGPRDELEGQPSMRRAAFGIALAKRLGARFIVAGDGVRGEDVRHFANAAREAELAHVIGAYDSDIPRPNTLTDARLILGHASLFCPDPVIHVVTDWWHLNRALTMTRGEATGEIFDRAYCAGARILPAPVVGGPLPTQGDLAREARGLQAYLAGEYGASHPGSYTLYGVGHDDLQQPTALAK